MPEIDISEFDERLNAQECNQIIRDIVGRLRNPPIICTPEELME